MSKPGKVLLWGALVGLVMGVCYAMLPRTDHANELPKSIASWAQWDGESEKPRAKVLVHVTEASGNAGYGYGNIRGLVYNRTKEAFNYIQVVFGLYSESGTKVATCMDNIAGLGGLDVWEFNAPCLDWRSGGSYRVESVTYW